MSTPALSIIFFIIVTLAALPLTGTQNYLPPIILFTILNTSITLLSIIGIILYIYGCMKREATNIEARPILLLSLFLIGWGVFTYLVASVFYSDLIRWSMNPGIRSLTIWDHLQYLTWELKAFTWIGTGILLTLTSLIKLHTH